MISQANSFRIPMKDNSVHCIVTSIPYYGLRDYGLPPLVFGGRSDCRHEWTTVIKHRESGGPQVSQTKWQTTTAIADGQRDTMSQFCQLCQAWRGSYGLEPSLSLFVQHSVEVARECKRVLRPDGVMWWNIGDSYATARNGRSAADGKAAGNDDRTFRDKPFTVDELPAKNLCLVPERIVIALQDDGWIVRSIAPWIKRNPMPESVKDRPGTAHEYIFMLTKGPRYYFDIEAVRRGKGQDSIAREKRGISANHKNTNGAPGQPPHSFMQFRENDPGREVEAGRALRTSDFFFDSLDAQIAHLEQIRDKGGMMVNDEGLPAAFVVNPKGYAGAHYATYPLELVSPMIKASTSERGCCPKCGAGWVRVVDTERWNSREERRGNARGANYVPGTSSLQRIHNTNGKTSGTVTQTLGWRPSCACLDRAIEAEWLRRGDETLQARIQIEAELTPQFEPTPAIVFDPFCGSGATLAAAHELGRRGIGLDLNPTYLAENALPRAEKRTSQRAIEQLPMFAA